MSRNNQFALKLALGLAITGTIFALLFRYVDLDQIGRLFAQTRWGWWTAGFVIWGVIYLVRAVRFCRLSPQTPYLTMLSITAVHNFLLRLMPLRTGELAYAYLVKRAGTGGFGESLFGLLLLRLLDAVMVVVLFAVALAFHQGTYLGERSVGIWAAALVGGVGVAAVLALVPLLRMGLALAWAVARGLRLDRRPKVTSTLERIQQSVSAFAKVQRPAILAITGLSAVQWLLTFLGFFAIMRAFSMPVSLAQTTLGSTAAVVAGFLPIGGIGTFGTQEAGWALGFSLVGLAQKQAVASGFGVSISTFGYGALLGLAGWMGLVSIGKRTRSREKSH